MFPEIPAIVFHDPLGELLGADDGNFRYVFDDVVKLAGHACPTAAGAFLLVVRAMPFLYGEDRPQRGDVVVTVHGGVEEGVNGPISQILTLLTGAAGENGFGGLAGQHNRKGLLRFKSRPFGQPLCFTFQSVSRNRSVTLSYSPDNIHADPAMGRAMQAVLSGQGSQADRNTFAALWRDRVLRILADEGRNTVREATL